MEFMYKRLKVCFLLLLLEYFVTQGLANHLKEHARPPQENRIQRQRPSRPPGPLRQSGPPRSPGSARKFVPPRSRGPVRQIGPVRQAGPPGPLWLKRQLRPPRPPGPLRQPGSPRPPGPPRQPGQARPRNPALPQGRFRSKEKIVRKQSFTAVPQGRFKSKEQLVRKQSFRQPSLPTTQELSKVGVSGMGKGPGMSRGSTSVKIDVRRLGPSLIQNKVKMERLNVPRDLDESKGSTETRQTIQKRDEVITRSKVAPRQRGPAKSQVSARRPSIMRSPGKPRVPVMPKAPYFTPLGHTGGQVTLGQVGQMPISTPVGHMGKAHIQTSLGQTSVGQMAGVRGQDFGMNALIQAIAKIIIMNNLLAASGVLHQRHYQPPAMVNRPPMSPMMSIWMMEGGLPELF